MGILVKEIVVKADTKGAVGLRDFSRRFGDMNRNIKSSADSLGLFRNLFYTAFAGFGIRQLTDMSDSMQLLSERIKALTGQKDVMDVMDGLAAAANRTKTNVDSLSNVYSRLIVNTEQYKFSSRTLIDLTETLQNTYRLSGASAEEASGSLIQLTQAMARGVLRGQEFVSVISQNAYLAALMRDEFKATPGELIKMAEQGLLPASKVLLVLFKNMEKVNSQAGNMKQTFGQTMITVLNDFKSAVFKINENYGAAEKFARAVNSVKNNLDILGATLAAVFAFKAVGWISALAAAFSVAALAAAAIPIAIASVVAGLVLLVVHFEKVSNFFKRIASEGVSYVSDTFSKIGISINAVIDKFNQLTGLGLKKVTLFSEYASGLKGLGEALRPVEKSLVDFKRAEYEEATASRLAAEQRMKEIKTLEQKEAAARALESPYIKLNSMYKNLRISLLDYFIELEKLKSADISKEFNKGKIDAIKYHTELNKFKELKLYAEFNSNKISLDEFNQRMRDLSIEELNLKLSTSKITLVEFKKELADVKAKYSLGFWDSLSAGIDTYLADIETAAQATSKVTNTALKGLEDGLVEFAEKWNQDWRQIGQTVINEITRMVVRMYVLKPILESIAGLLGSIGGTSTGGGSLTPAPIMASSGAAFDSMGFKRFASGGVVNTPTPFTFGGGSRGLMGEAGAEAILPLTRTSSGNLGVEAKQSPVVVNIVNNSQAGIEQRETTGPGGERILDILITNKVKEGIASGTFDRTFSQSFGLNRRGN